jgi:hypothetical protein
MELITAQKFALKFKLNLQPLRDLKVRGTARLTEPQKGIPREIVQKNTTSSSKNFFFVKTSSLFYLFDTINLYPDENDDRYKMSAFDYLINA